MSEAHFEYEASNIAVFDFYPRILSPLQLAFNLAEFPARKVELGIPESVKHRKFFKQFLLLLLLQPISDLCIKHFRSSGRRKAMMIARILSFHFSENSFH